MTLFSKYLSLHFKTQPEIMQSIHLLLVSILFLVGTGCQQDQSRTETIAALSTPVAPADQVAPEPSPEALTKSDYEHLYRDVNLPKDQRIKAIKELADQYLYKQEYPRFLQLSKEYKQLFGDKEPDRGDGERYMIATAHDVQRFLTFCDSMEHVNWPPDSVYYAQALALVIIENISWGESRCAGDLPDLVTGKLESFSQRFPNSQLVDDAAWYTLDMLTADLWGDDIWLADKIQQLERFLKQYPDSDFKSDAQYRIFQLYLYAWDSLKQHKSDAKAAAGKFIAKYPDDPRVAEIEQRLDIARDEYSHE
jgi:hypothetical protein